MEPKPGTGPFLPTDTSVLNIKRIEQQVAKRRQALLHAQTELTKLRYGPGPDNTPPPIRDVTRADGQWPFLLVRSVVGDTGARRQEAEGGKPGHALARARFAHDAQRLARRDREIDAVDGA